MLIMRFRTIKRQTFFTSLSFDKSRKSDFKKP